MKQTVGENWWSLSFNGKYFFISVGVFLASFPLMLMDFLTDHVGMWINSNNSYETTSQHAGQFRRSCWIHDPTALPTLVLQGSLSQHHSRFIDEGSEAQGRSVTWAHLRPLNWQEDQIPILKAFPTIQWWNLHQWFSWMATKNNNKNFTKDKMYYTSKRINNTK